MKTKKKAKFLLLISSFFFSLILTELFLRLLNFEPWRYEKAYINNEIFFEAHNQLGWLSKKGNYQLIINNNSNSKINFSIEEDSNRTTGSKDANKKNIIIVGGSFTQGWGINDNETYPFLLQKALNNYNVYNYGQSGYGGFQSLLLTKKKINKKKPSSLLIYGFIEHHEERNVAREKWLETLLKYSNKEQKIKIKVPYATLNKNTSLVYNKPIAYLQLPFREKLALVNLIEKFYMKQLNRHRKKIQRKVAEQIFIELDTIAKENNAIFLVVNLHYSNKNNANYYEEFLNKNNIHYIDCARNLSEKLLLEGDFHPNAKGHKMYSDCIKNYLDNKLFF